MMSLGSFIKGLRGERSQAEIAKAAGLDKSMISLAESGKAIRPETLEAICRKGLRVSEADWLNAKILWLELSFGEPLRKDQMDKAIDNLVVREISDHEQLLEDIAHAINKNRRLIQKQSLGPKILSFIQDPQALASIEHFHQVVKAFRP